MPGQPDSGFAGEPRRAARAILLTPDHEVLLMQIRHPQSGALFWITPGGGLQAGESLTAALRRELNEELGLTEFEIGPLLWQRQHSFDWDQRRICQREDYYLVHSQRFEPIISDPVEATLLQAFRWWRLAELVFFAGGDQCRYVSLFKGSALERAVKSVFARHGGVGGTSAGLAIQGSMVYDACQGSVTSAEALADPYHAEISTTTSHRLLRSL